VFFCNIFRTVDGRVTEFCEFSLTVIRYVLEKKSKPEVNCLITQLPFEVKSLKITSKKLLLTVF